MHSLFDIFEVTSHRNFICCTLSYLLPGQNTRSSTLILHPFQTYVPPAGWYSRAGHSKTKYLSSLVNEIEVAMDFGPPFYPFLSQKDEEG